MSGKLENIAKILRTAPKEEIPHDALPEDFRNRVEEYYAQERKNCLTRANSIAKEVNALPNPFKNVRKGTEYSEKFELPEGVRNPHLKDLFKLTKDKLPEDVSEPRLADLGDLGLAWRSETDPARLVISGTPRVAGEYNITLEYSYEGWSNGMPLLTRKFPFLIKPAPQDLWKNLPVPEDIEYPKPDADSAFVKGAAGSDGTARKDMVAASRRGRAHAHEGKPRDDDFKLCYCPESAWYILAVADGAGSAAFAREGSRIACEAAVKFCEEKLRDPNNDFDGFLKTRLDNSQETPEASLLAGQCLEEGDVQAGACAAPGADEARSAVEEKPEHHKTAMHYCTWGQMRNYLKYKTVIPRSLTSIKTGMKKKIPLLIPSVTYVKLSHCLKYTTGSPHSPWIKYILRYIKTFPAMEKKLEESAHGGQILKEDTSKTAANAALSAHKKLLYTEENSKKTILDEQCRQDIRKNACPLFAGAARSAYDAIGEEARRKERPLKEYATTLLLTICKKFPQGYLILSFNIGDGAIGILYKEKDQFKIQLNCTPDEGEFGGQTRFVTMQEVVKDDEELNKRIHIALRQDFKAVMLMTDGVSDAKFETCAGLNSAEKWEALWKEMRSQVHLFDDRKASDELLEWLDFYSHGNHDDRTLAILY